MPLEQVAFDWQTPALVAGVDEAGRGPLAGPVVAAAVILDERQPIAGLADSKKLSAARREALYDETSRQFVQAFMRSLPGLTQEEVSWRFIFVLGTYQYALSNTGRLEVISEGRSSGKDFTRALQEMIPFLAAGMRAGPAIRSAP